MDSADVRSIDIIREWLGALNEFHDQAAEALGGSRMEIRRAEEWLQEQLSLWQKAVRDRDEAMHQAKMALMAKKTPGPSGREPDTTLEERALRRARARYEHAQEQVAKCKQYIVKFPRMVEEMFTAPSHRLQTFMETDLVRAEAVLLRQSAALESYADMKSVSPSRASVSQSPPAPPKEGV